MNDNNTAAPVKVGDMTSSVCLGGMINRMSTTSKSPE